VTKFFKLHKTLFQRIKVDWNIQVNKIAADSISVIQIEDDIKHSFSKFIFQMKVK